MRFVRMFELFVVMGIALLVVAGTASATLITSPTGTPYTGAIHTEHEGTHAILHTPFAKIECGSTFELIVEAHEGGITASGKFTSLTFSPCTNNWHVTVTALGSWEIHPNTEYGGSLTSTGLSISATRLGVTCNYETKSTQLGTITGGNPGKVDIAGSIPVASGSSGLCGSGNSSWTGSYKMTGPVYVDPEI